MKLEIEKPKNPLQWALDIAGKTEVPYAATVLYSKSMEINAEWKRVSELHGRSKNKETKLTLDTLAKMARECERACEILIIGL
tara:strand:+ start:544 stop:792 length:249 start_codon:yes stop_codon:yes gene_type:complete